MHWKSGTSHRSGATLKRFRGQTSYRSYCHLEQILSYTFRFRISPVTIDCVTPGAAGVGCYAVLVPGQNRYAGKHNVDQWMNPAAFTDPPPATTIGQTDFSPLGGYRTPIIAPGFHRMDWSLFKDFNTSETTRLEFRAEFFNLTNHPNFAAPSERNYQNTGHFGQITSTIDSPNDPRQIQFALKFYF